jgi:hypothetical protein
MNKIVLAIAMSLVTLSAGAVTRGGIATAGVYNYFNADNGTGIFAKSFTYQVTTSYSAECTWSNHTRTKFPIVHTDGANVNSSLAYINGAHRVFNGYSLAGFGTTFSSGDNIPVIGAQCKKGKAIGTWTALDTMSVDGGLYANYGTSQTLVY